MTKITKAPNQTMALWLSGVKTWTVYTPLMHFLSGGLLPRPIQAGKSVKKGNGTCSLESLPATVPTDF